LHRELRRIPPLEVRWSPIPPYGELDILVRSSSLLLTYPLVILSAAKDPDAPRTRQRTES